MQLRTIRPVLRTFAIHALLAANAVHAQAVSLPLSGLNGSNGFAIDGETAGDGAGRSVSTAGDVNGDGSADLIIGADAADPNGLSSGRSYVVFGRSTGFDPLITLASLEGGNGFRIDGEVADDFSGRSVSAAGDINGDGLDDLIVGASGANTGNSGRGYVVFGRNGGFPGTLQLAGLDGSTGFVIDGEFASDSAGDAVGRAGDINADGLDDLVIAAPNADPTGSNSGRVYVVFGRETGFPSPLLLSSLDGLNGFAINGENQGDFFGRSAKGTGDVNGDGIDDLIVGANNASRDASSPNSGRVYVLFGSSSGFVTPMQISSLDGSNGFFINGEFGGDQTGASVDGAGDVNADGVDDLVIGAGGANPNGIRSGRSYVVFGRGTGFAAELNLSSLDGSNGFALDGEAESDASGRSVSAAGDINGDGFKDLIIGAPGVSAGSSSSGRSYVILGRSSGFASPLPLSNLDGLGFVIDGAAQDDNSGTSVSAAGDINNDGVDDLIIGAPNARRANGQRVGRSYVVFGVSELIFRDSFD